MQSLKHRFTFGYPILYLLIISAVIRALMASWLCLGNDEAYYYTYALYPALSHFDHPPMVGWVIQLFSLNLHLNSELFIRMAAVIAGTINTWLVYCIGKQLRDERTGWYAALLYSASVYGFIIIGVFILPDTPQSVFWLAAILLLLQAFRGEIDSVAKRKFLLASVCIGLAMLSKYSSAYLWLGMIIYILIYKRKWLKTGVFYWAHLVMVLLFMPVIIWNVHNHFVSFLFHSGRVEPAAAVFRVDYFFTELLGEMLYTNPVNLILIILAVAAFFKGKLETELPSARLLIWSAIPLIITFLAVSITRRTLPHWNGPGNLTLLPLAALWIRNRTEMVWPTAIKGSLAFMLLVLSLATMQISTGFIPTENPATSIGKEGENDFSLDLYGWRQLRKEFIR